MEGSFPSGSGPWWEAGGTGGAAPPRAYAGPVNAAETAPIPGPAGGTTLAPARPAPDLDDGDDPFAWHHVSALPRHAMRRRRRIDVYRGESASRVGIDAMFRDTYVRTDGVETIIHEYTLAAEVDTDSGVIVESVATPRVLPWQECPGAVASAARITGMTLQELHFRVRRELSGTSTCTHLNDLLRSIADAEPLIDRLR